MARYTASPTSTSIESACQKANSVYDAACPGPLHRAGAGYALHSSRERPFYPRANHAPSDPADSNMNARTRPGQSWWHHGYAGEKIHSDQREVEGCRKWRIFAGVRFSHPHGRVGAGPANMVIGGEVGVRFRDSG